MTRDDIVEDIEREERERRERSDILRRQRSEEAQQLIAKRTIDARAVFERNTSAGQLNQRRASYQPNGLAKTEETIVSPDTSPNEQPIAAMGRKASLPTWLPGTSETYQTETSGNKNKNVNVVNGNEQNNTVKNHVEKNPIEEEQEWEGKWNSSV